jgi:hypothetical protein
LVTAAGAAAGAGAGAGAGEAGAGSVIGVTTTPVTLPFTCFFAFGPLVPLASRVASRFSLDVATHLDPVLSERFLVGPYPR